MESRSRNLGFGFPGFPKATRSSRGRTDHSARKSAEGSDGPKDSCFFELLATVAGQLLQEQDEEALMARSLIELESPKAQMQSRHAGSISDNARSDAAIQSKEEDICDIADYSKHARHPANKGYEPFVANSCRERNCDVLFGQKQNTFTLEGPLKARSSRKRKMAVAMSRQGSAAASMMDRNMRTSPEDRITLGSDHCTTKNDGVLPQDVHPAYSMDLHETVLFDKQEGVPGQHCKVQRQEIDLAPFPDMDSPLLVSSGSSEETPLFSDYISCSTIAFESNRPGNVREEFFSRKVGDDDDNSSESTVRKSLLTKSSSMSYTHTTKPRRYTNSTPRRRALGFGLKRKCQEIEDGERNRNEKARVGKKKASKSPMHNNDNDQSKNSPLGTLVDTNPDDKSKIQPLHSERDKSSSVLSSASPSKRDDSNVKLNIQSFMVPELMVVLPESATVANLKKAVMEAAMNLLGGGLCVRVLLEGKKVTDETESLLQAGIPGSENSLGFMLEPNPFPASASGGDDTFLVLSHNGNQTSSRYPVLSKSSEINNGSFHVGPTEGMLEVDANSSGTEMQSTTVSPNKDDEPVNDSKGLVLPSQCALVLHASQINGSPNGLAVVPFGQNSTSIGMNKRRIRRPFSVAEVEVLVQAVETLGTGRWRDVKLQAFPQAKHRTYVDLKDKWKTLVHTASIAPHQRRGEPVPQVLLDRVIQAHSYWTAQQAKQQSMETKVF